MATDKNNSNTPEEKSTLTKIAETIGTVAGEIAVKKRPAGRYGKRCH